MLNWIRRWYNWRKRWKEEIVLLKEWSVWMKIKIKI